MNLFRSGTFRSPALALFLLLAFAPLRSASGLGTALRSMPSYSWGVRTYTCLLIDGGEAPIFVPPVGGPTVQAGGGGVSILWPKDGTTAIIRDGSPAEAKLAKMMDTPDGPDAWAKYMVSTLHGPGYKYSVHDCQPDFVDFNGWRISAIEMDYELGGRKSSSMMLLWRTKNGATLVVTMQADPASFAAHAGELRSLIGGMLLLPMEK